MNTNKWTFNTDALKPEITPEHVYRRRRQFFKTAALAGAGALLAGCAPQVLETGSPAIAAGQRVKPLVDTPTSYEDITNYVNYYEYTTNQTGCGGYGCRISRTSPWQVEVYGLAAQPKSYSVEDMLQRFYPGGAHLPHALRGRLVDGHPLAGFFAGSTIGRSPAARDRQICAL